MTETLMIKRSIFSPIVKNRVPKLLIPSGRLPDHDQLLVQNQHNFEESGKPVTFMLYKDGSWGNFEKHVMDVLVSAFVSGKAVIEVEMEGIKLIVDFYRMLGVDLGSGNQMPISWIDVNDRYFFPKAFIDDSENVDGNLSLENFMINERGKWKRESEENEVGTSSSKNVKVRCVTESLPPKWPRTRSLRDTEEPYQNIKGLLSSLSGDCVTITAIHQCTRIGPMEKLRLEFFEDHVEKVRRVRGNPRVVYGWYGTSSKTVDSIMRRGFEIDRIVPDAHHRGVSLYLSPLLSPHVSDKVSETDENGEKHMILCRVTLGNLEKIELGCKQYFRSSADFDNGVDDLMDPQLYVVWYGNMTSHILPDYIVSYKCNRHIPGPQNGVDRACNLWSRMLFKLHSLLPLQKKMELATLYTCYRENKQVAKEIFMRQVQAIVRDDKLIRSVMLDAWSFLY